MTTDLEVIPPNLLQYLEGVDVSLVKVSENDAVALRKALVAIHFFVDASPIELDALGVTREQVLYHARTLFQPFQEQSPVPQVQKGDCVCGGVYTMCVDDHAINCPASTQLDAYNKMLVARPCII